MTVSLQSLFLAMVVVTLLAAGNCLLAWLQHRREPSLLWMGLSSLTACLAITLRIHLPLGPAIIIATPLFLVSFGLIWVALRTLNDEPPEAAAVILPILVWLGLCFSDKFRGQMDLRIGLGLLLALIPISLTTHELWTMRATSRVIRWPLLGLMGLQMLLMLHRAVRSLLWPHIAYAPLGRTPGANILIIDILAIMLILSSSMVSLVKDKTLRQQHQNARTDPLTGLTTRWYFDITFPKRFAQAQATSQPLALILANADHLAALNHSQGRAAGDHGLRLLASLLTAAARPGDLVARYGGDEFVLLLPNTPLEAAQALAATAHEQLRLAHAPLTLSLGVAAFTPATGLTSADDLLSAAEQALAAAKSAGGNQVSQMF
jgi:diguanylate cyclase (GGDEF)-like protein